MPKNRVRVKTRKCRLCKKESVLLRVEGFCTCKATEDDYIDLKLLVDGRPTIVRKINPEKKEKVLSAYKKAGGGSIVGNTGTRRKKRRRQENKKFPVEQKTVSRSRRKAFYESWEWKAVRYDVLKQHGAVCMMCGADRTQSRICVDHIKPLGKNWSLRLKKENLQVLCNDCNMGKSDKFEDNFKNPLTAKTISDNLPSHIN